MAICSSNETKMWLNARQYTIAGYATKTIEIQTGATYKQTQKVQCRLEHEGKYRKSNKKSFNKTAARIVCDHMSKYQTSIFMQIYSAITGEDYKLKINMDALNSAYNIYISMFSEIQTVGLIQYQPLSINDGWILANELRSGEAMLENCKECNSLYLCSENQNTTIDCPFCYKSGKVKRPSRRKKVADNEEVMEVTA